VVGADASLVDLSAGDAYTWPGEWGRRNCPYRKCLWWGHIIHLIPRSMCWLIQKQKFPVSEKFSFAGGVCIPSDLDATLENLQRLFRHARHVTWTKMVSLVYGEYQTSERKVHVPSLGVTGLLSRQLLSRGCIGTKTAVHLREKASLTCDRSASVK
jgi:hypothetical protein